MRVFVGGRVLLPGGRLAPAAVAVRAGVVVEVWPGASAEQARRRVPAAEVIELGGILAPGFIDLHIHGFAGHDLGTCASEGVLEMAVELSRTGVTGFLATIASSGPAETLRQVERIRRAAERQVHGARILGIRLEGPYLSAGKRGAQQLEALRPPLAAEFVRLRDAAGAWLRMIDLAPELPGALDLVRLARASGVLPCTGHTEASTAQAAEAVAAGATHCTHLFDAMPALHHREPGPAGVYLAGRHTTVEVIADGIHLHPVTLGLAVRAIGPARCALVTDAILAAGLPDGEYRFLGRSVKVAGGAVRLPDGTLAGSTLTLDRAVRNLHRLAGAPLAAALRMASATPARILGDRLRGSLEPGRAADLVHLDGDLAVVQTWIGGEPAPRAAPLEAVTC